MESSGDLCVTNSVEEFFSQPGGCLVQLQFLWVVITLTGAGLLLLVVLVEAVILIICACHVHKQKRESRGKYSLKAEAKKDGKESVELQLRKGLVVSSQENLSDPHKGTEVYRDAPQSAQPLTDGDAIPIQERQYDAIASSSQKDPQQSKLSVTVENTQYASIDDNTTSSAPAPPPPPPPPPLPASNSAMRTPTLQKNPAAPPPTEVFSIGDVGAVTVGDYQYASVDKSGKERASSPQPPPPPPPPPPLLLESNKPSLSASAEHLPDHLNAVADTQYAVVDKTRKNLTPPPAPPPPPSFPPSGARSTGDILDYVNSQGGALPASSDPAAQLQAAIDSLYDSVV